MRSQYLTLRNRVMGQGQLARSRPDTLHRSLTPQALFAGRQSVHRMRRTTCVRAHPSLPELLMGPWRLPSVRWPLLLLMASVGFTTLGVVEANRAIRSQRTAAEHALRDYAGFVAWSYEQHLRELLAAGTQEVLGAVNHGTEMHTNPRVPEARDLAHYLPYNPKCGC